MSRQLFDTNDEAQAYADEQEALGYRCIIESTVGFDPADAAVPLINAWSVDVFEPDEVACATCGRYEGHDSRCPEGDDGISDLEYDIRKDHEMGGV